MIFGKDKPKDKFKFIGLKVYAWDRVYGSNKKYRRVFDRAELTYLSVELSMYNKLFDESVWKSDIKIIGYKLNGDDKTQLCENLKSVEIPIDQNIYTYSFGWGNDERGKFWKKGIYQWEAYMDGQLIDTTKFYIEEEGLVSTAENPFLSAMFFNTYEAPKGDLEADKREYLKTFDVNATRYIMGELRFKNLLPIEWYCEMFFNIYDDTGLFIGSSDSFTIITPESGPGEMFTTTAGWGAADPGTWIEDNYTMELVFMDSVIAVVPFSIGKEAVKRLSECEALLNEDVGSFYNDTVELKKSNVEIDSKKEESSDEVKTEDTKVKEEVEIFIDDRPVEEILADLDGLIGLENIKKKIREYIDYVSFLQYRTEAGIEENEDVVLHSVFTGNPGTGKTTVVKLLGMIFKSMGLLSKGHIHNVEANDLISGYVRQSGKDTKEAIEKARGGILFIDEAYMLYKEGATNDFGPESVAALITEMSDGKGDLAIMVAGYPKEMDRFIESNPGLKSRFRNYFHFEDYTPDELFDIAEFAAKKKGLKISKSAAVAIKEVIVDAYRKRDRTFGNARFANALIDEAKINLGMRVMKDPKLEVLTKAQLSTLKAADIENPANSSSSSKLNLDIDENLLREALGELDQLTGLSNIKQEVNELIKLSRYYKESNRDILKAFSMHSVFMGNPGTGKTTVARIIAKVYKALGLLERGHLIDADGSDLVAGYLGQTSLKTKELIKKAMGGILFIDEAYAITEGRNADFGRKAVAAIIKEMEDHRSEFGVIVAGYTHNMKEFLESNPGLKSRFDQDFLFEDFTESELWEIVVNMLNEKGLIADSEAEKHLKAYISYLYTKRDRFFGNARSMRKIVEKITRNHELRMADLDRSKRTEKVMQTLALIDVNNFNPIEEKTAEHQRLGFKY